MKMLTTLTKAALMSVAGFAAFAGEDQVVIQPGPSPVCAKVKNAGCYALWILDERMKIDEAFPGGRARAILHNNGYENADWVKYLEPGRYILVDDQAPNN